MVCFSGRMLLGLTAQLLMQLAIAKNIVAAGLAQESRSTVAYAIDCANLCLSVLIPSGTATVAGKLKHDLLTASRQVSSNVILNVHIYRQTAAYGHGTLGRSDLPWEKLVQGRCPQSNCRSKDLLLSNLIISSNRI